MDKNISTVIRQMRSIRKSTTQIPGDQEIEQILDAARWAPSGQTISPGSLWLFRIQRREKVSRSLFHIKKQ